MSKIKNEDLGENKGEDKKLTAEEMEQVKGGPAYLKLGDIDGESVKIGDVTGDRLKIGDIKGESLKINDVTLKRG